MNDWKDWNMNPEVCTFSELTGYGDEGQFYRAVKSSDLQLCRLLSVEY